MKYFGQCLCGQVKIATKHAPHNITACHCQMCRRWSSAPLLAVDCEDDLIIIEGEELIKHYTSSEWAERGFCSECGTHLFYYFKRNNTYEVSIGLFDNIDDSQLILQIYTDNKPPYYNFVEKTPMLTEQDVISTFNNK